MRLLVGFGCSALGRGRPRPIAVTVAVMLAVVAGVAPVAAAAPAPVAPEFFGVQDDRVQPLDPAAWATGRLWAAWCSVQPRPELEVGRAARDLLRPAFKTFAASETRRLTVSLGHPAPWVFGDHPAAVRVRPKHVWYCDRHASVTSFPAAGTLQAGPVGEAYAAYVAAVIRASRPYLAADARNMLVLQAWNEPNLRNGGTVREPIPGAARTWRQASASLREQERIIWRVAAEMIPGRFEVTSPSLYGKPTALGGVYLKEQAKSRTVDSFSLNIYTVRQRSVNRSLELWRSKARIAKRLVTRYPSLRFLPIWVTETNHNLVNGVPDVSNIEGEWADPRAQKRLLEVTTMEALRLGFAGLQWYQGSPTQTAVTTLPGSPAAEAVTALRAELVGRMVTGCSTHAGVTTCTLSARPDSGPILVRWSRTGTDGIEIVR